MNKCDTCPSIYKQFIIFLWLYRGFKKGKKRHQAETFKENAQSGHYYNRLHGTIARQETGVDFVQLREQVNSSSLRDAEYEEIKNLDRHQMYASETDKDDVFTSPMSQNLCAVRVDGNGYLSPTATVKQSTEVEG